ncbi:hypothetical protein NKG05_17525 [Oerskovia sp. M15]
MVWRIAVLLALLGVSALFGVWWQRRQGVVRTAAPDAGGDGVDWASRGSSWASTARSCSSPASSARRAAHGPCPGRRRRRPHGRDTS